MMKNITYFFKKKDKKYHAFNIFSQRIREPYMQKEKENRSELLIPFKLGIFNIATNLF